MRKRKHYFGGAEVNKKFFEVRRNISEAGIVRKIGVPKGI